jgi:hypothetical protein
MIQKRKKKGTTVMQMMAKVATMEPCSKAFFRFPGR